MNSKLPKNTTFGYFFSTVFILISVYFFYQDNSNLFITFISISVLLFFISLLKPVMLFPLNKLWMRFGFFLNIIVSPIILGFIFYITIMPIAIIMRMFKRDELRIIVKKKKTHWINIDYSKEENINFKNQF